MQSRSLWLLSCLFILMVLPLQAFGKNGFNLDNSTIPLNKILQGGPPRDGIPSLDKPTFMTAGEAGYLKPDDRILGVFHKGEARAYPIRILNWHEIVNDRIQGDAVSVPFALCVELVWFIAAILTVNHMTLEFRDCCITAMCCSMTARPKHCGHKFCRRRLAGLW